MIDNINTQNNNSKIESLITTGDEIAEEINKVKKLLNSAKGWNTLEDIDNGLISSIVIHKKLKKVEQCFTNISNLVQTFKNMTENIDLEKICLSSINDAFIIYFDSTPSDMQMGIYLTGQYNRVCGLEKFILEIIEDLKNSFK